MKTLPLFYTLAIGAMLTSCGHNAKQSAQEAASTTTEESLPDGTTTAEAASSSLDCQTFRLKGDVIEVKVFMESIDGGNVLNEDFTFDQRGRLSSYEIETFDGPKTITYAYPDDESLQGTPANPEVAQQMGIDCEMRRDEQGRLNHCPQNDFEYGADGRITKETSYGWEASTTYTYTQYNEHGDPLAATFTGFGEGMEWNGTLEYVYDTYDDHGNWLKCQQKWHYTTEGFDDTTDVYSRQIIYGE